MPSVLTTFGANYFLDVLLGRSREVPEVFFFALLTQPPGEATTGVLLSEPPPGAGYGRVQVPNDTDVWGEAQGGYLATRAAIEFPVAVTEWPVVTHYALCEGSYEGGVFLYGSFAVPRKITVGDKVSIPAGLLTLTATSLSTAVSSAF